jgi:hypothetical protein
MPTPTARFRNTRRSAEVAISWPINSADWRRLTDLPLSCALRTWQWKVQMPNSVASTIASMRVPGSMRTVSRLLAWASAPGRLLGTAHPVGRKPNTFPEVPSDDTLATDVLPQPFVEDRLQDHRLVVELVLRPVNEGHGIGPYRIEQGGLDRGMGREFLAVAPLELGPLCRVVPEPTPQFGARSDVS